MKRFLVFEGDGNHGTFYTDYIEAENLDEAVEKYKERLTDWTKENLHEDGDDEVAYLTIYEGPNGETALNDGAYFIAEIWEESKCPKASVRWRDE